MRLSKLMVAFLAVIVSPCALAEATQAQGPSMAGNILLLVGFLGIFYFMLIRPQTKRAKEHQSLISGIAKEDEVIINGGILGKVQKITEQFFVVTIADGIDIKVQKQAVSALVPKGTMKNI